MTIDIVESNAGFALVTNISPVNSETDTAVINIGHADETHYVSTVPLFEETMVNNVIHNNQPAQSTMDQCRTTNNDQTTANMLMKEQKRKACVKEYMTRRRRDNEFRNKQNRALQAKRSEICKRQGSSKDRHLLNAKNQVLIISGNLISRHLLKVNRITLSMYQK